MLEKASFFFNQKDDQIFDNLLAFLIHLLVTKTGLLRINLIFTRLRTHARARTDRIMTAECLTSSGTHMT